MAPVHVTTLARLCFYAPLLCAGVRMTVDPAFLFRFGHTVSGALRDFEQRLRGFARGRRIYGARSFEIPARAGNKARLAGIVLTIYAFAVLARIVN